ncbi:chymotrypsin-2-like [Solenopsis invicta]|uniref:chymotrypsin-2-like n=1 Tax=Solenopsis invicta TaxID=13686 RepID=UPI000595AEDE|nr:chymotrypsin-2-like [Solenopsis invicta]
MRQISCILIALAIVGVYGDEPDKLVNGIPTTIEEYPHCVSLRVKDNNHFCCGSIIDPEYILTAGHCIVPLEQDSSLMESLTIVSGTTYLDNGGEVHKAAKVWLHENYNTRSSGRGPYDIGLIKLTKPMEFGPTQRSVLLPTKKSEKNMEVTIGAWGSEGFRKPIHNNLQKLDASVMLADTCQTYHHFIMKIHKHEICTLIKRGTGMCNGDSGSGLITNTDIEKREIVGVTSGGIPCATGYPDVFTDVYSYVSWIKEKMEEK